MYVSIALLYNEIVSLLYNCLHSDATLKKIIFNPFLDVNSTKIYETTSHWFSQLLAAIVWLFTNALLTVPLNFFSALQTLTYDQISGLLLQF